MTESVVWGGRYIILTASEEQVLLLLADQLEAAAHHPHWGQGMARYFHYTENIKKIVSIIFF